VAAACRRANFDGGLIQSMMLGLISTVTSFSRIIEAELEHIGNYWISFPQKRNAWLPEYNF